MFPLLFKYSPYAYSAGELSFASGWPLWLLGALIAVGAVAFAVSLLRQRHLNWWKKLIIGTMQTLLLATVARDAVAAGCCSSSECAIARTSSPS